MALLNHSEDLSPILEQVDSLCSDLTLSPDANDNIPIGPVKPSKLSNGTTLSEENLLEENVDEDTDNNSIDKDFSGATGNDASAIESPIVDDLCIPDYHQLITQTNIPPTYSVDNIYKCVRVHQSNSNVLSEAHLLNHVQKLCRAFSDQFQHRSFEHCIGESVYKEAQMVVAKELGFTLERSPSLMIDGGRGVFVREGTVPPKSLVAFYPGTVYSPGDSVFVQSIANPFVFRCIDYSLVDGNDKYLSKILYRSCALRDRIGKYVCCDLTWLTERPLNPLALGQYVNNGTIHHPSNVVYQEANLPLEHFPLPYRRFLPNVWYNSSDGGHQYIKLVLLLSTREIQAGEELFSNYFTVVTS